MGSPFSILELLELQPSLQSLDFVRNKTQYHLHKLLTEQRHPKTRLLSWVIREDLERGLRMLLAVDKDITAKLADLAEDPSVLEQMVHSVVTAIEERRRIYVYGCGATGRLAKQMESAFWRPFWRKAKGMPLWERLRGHVSEDIEEKLVGEMTGADRALVSSLEGFEDLQLIGRLQLKQHQIRPGDLVICVTEGGETSSVIGAILAAAEQFGPEARDHLYFVYNNPDEVLRPLVRSASVLDNPTITKLNLTTGPQAITGSTRLQATTIETFVLGAVLEQALENILRRRLSAGEMAQLDFGEEKGIRDRLRDFDKLQRAVEDSVPSWVRLTQMETDCYRGGHRAIYFAKSALITVFIDCAERSPTFRLFPLDKVDSRPRRSWVQVWTEGRNGSEAWRRLLGRHFRGLPKARYQREFENISDPYLKSAAIKSLENAGDDQETAYDFSFSQANLKRSDTEPGDIRIAVLFDNELNEGQNSSFRKFIQSPGIVVTVGSRGAPNDCLLPADFLAVPLDSVDDPLNLRRHIALKMLLNAHSTGIMAGLGRLVGNAMTGVSPSNLKLIGRATFLVMSAVNDRASSPITFSEANAVLFDAMDFVRAHSLGQTAEVALSIIRMIESLNRGAAVGWPEAKEILEKESLSAYLARNTPE